MQRVYDSLTEQYDLRLVFLAGLICITTCLISMNLFVRANDAAKGKDAAILDTLARVLFMQGKKEEAIKQQDQAVTLAAVQIKESLQKTLESYKNGKLPKAD